MATQFFEVFGVKIEMLGGVILGGGGCGFLRGGSGLDLCQESVE